MLAAGTYHQQRFLESLVGTATADHVGCHRGFIHGCAFSDSSGGGIQMKGGSSDILVHGNTFTDIAARAINAGGSTGLPYFPPRRRVVEGSTADFQATCWHPTRPSIGAIQATSCTI